MRIHNISPVMLRICLALVLIAFKFSTEAQSYEVKFCYDLNGNRIKRTLVEVQQLKSAASIETDTLKLQNPTEGTFVFPNPVEDELKVILNYNDDELLCRYMLYNLTGMLLEQGNLEKFSENIINMKRYHSGIYMLIIYKNNEKEIYKIFRK